MATVLGSARLQGLTVQGSVELGTGGESKFTPFGFPGPRQLLGNVTFRGNQLTPRDTGVSLAEVNVGKQGQVSATDMNLVPVSGSYSEPATLIVVGNEFLQSAHDRVIQDTVLANAGNPDQVYMGGNLFIENTTNGLFSKLPYWSSAVQALRDSFPAQNGANNIMGTFNSSGHASVPLSASPTPATDTPVSANWYFTQTAAALPNAPTAAFNDANIANALSILARPTQFTYSSATQTVLIPPVQLSSGVCNIVFPDTSALEAPAYNFQRAIELLMGVASSGANNQAGVTSRDSNTGLRFGDFVSVDIHLAFLLGNGLVINAGIAFLNHATAFVNVVNSDGTAMNQQNNVGAGLNSGWEGLSMTRLAPRLPVTANDQDSPEPCQL